MNEKFFASNNNIINYFILEADYYYIGLLFFVNI